MSTINVGNAPCSWGTLEFDGLAGDRLAYTQMLDELLAAGYTGTELGDWGFMPTEPAALHAALHRRSLTLTGAFVPVALKDVATHTGGEAAALKVARLLRSASEGEEQPFLVLADANGMDPIRTRYAGRITHSMGLSRAEWTTFAHGAERIARAVLIETGLRTVFHHHCAGYIETPDEIAHLLALTDPSILGLVFDTGHYLYGTGSNNGAAVVEGLSRFGDRIWYMHFKDCAPQLAEHARAGEWDYFTAVQRGVFCELGQGAVDFTAVLGWLHEHNYGGYITVEQDILPGMGEPYASAQRNRAYLRQLGL